MRNTIKTMLTFVVAVVCLGAMLSQAGVIYSEDFSGSPVGVLETSNQTYVETTSGSELSFGQFGYGSLYGSGGNGNHTFTGAKMNIDRTRAFGGINHETATIVFIDTSSAAPGLYNASFLVGDYGSGANGDSSDVATWYTGFALYEGTHNGTLNIRLATGAASPVPPSIEFPSEDVGNNGGDSGPSTFAQIGSAVEFSANGTVTVTFELTDAGTAGDFLALSWISFGNKGSGYAAPFSVDDIVVGEVTSTALKPGLDGADFDSATSWENDLAPSSSVTGTVNVSAANLARATANFGGNWTINHTAGDLVFNGGWNVNGGGAGGTYNLSGGSIQVTGTGGGDDQNFQANGIDFNISGGNLSASGPNFGVNNGGTINMLGGSGTISAAVFNKTVGTMTFINAWKGSATIDSLDAAGWETLLATTLDGSTIDGVDITPANFASNFRVVGSTLSIPRKGTLISIR